MTPSREGSVAQRFAVAIGLFTTVTGVIGMALNQSLATGADATAESFIVAWIPKLAVRRARSPAGDRRDRRLSRVGRPRRRRS